MTKDVNELIDHLLQDHKPMEPEQHPLFKVLPLMLIIVLYMSLVTSVIGLRSDWKPEFITQFGTYQLELIMSLTLGITALLATGWLRIPYMKSQKWMVSLACVSAVVFFSFEIYRLISEGIRFSTIESLIECYIHSIVLASIPVALLVMLQKSGSPTKPHLSAVMGTLAITGFAWISLRLTCSVNLAGHNAIVQLSPFMILGLALGVYARKLYKW